MSFVAHKEGSLVIYPDNVLVPTKEFTFPDLPPGWGWTYKVGTWVDQGSLGMYIPDGTGEYKGHGPTYTWFGSADTDSGQDPQKPSEPSESLPLPNDWPDALKSKLDELQQVQRESNGNEGTYIVTKVSVDLSESLASQNRRLFHCDRDKTYGRRRGPEVRYQLIFDPNATLVGDATGSSSPVVTETGRGNETSPAGEMNNPMDASE